MSLQHGNGTPMQGQETMYTDEQKRDIQRGTILLAIRRYLRIITLIGFVLMLGKSLIFPGPNDSTLEIVLGCIVFAAFFYGFFWLVTMVGANFCIKIYLYFRDLFTSKNTRI